MEPAGGIRERPDDEVVPDTEARKAAHEAGLERQAPKEWREAEARPPEDESAGNQRECAAKAQREWQWGAAPHVAHIQAYDIVAASVDAAQRRLAILGLSERAACHCVEPQHLLATMVARAPVAFMAGGSSRPAVDIVLIYAVLEHQTVPERLETLSACWNLLRPGGMLVVADTPNRLTYWDAHTSDLPFFHMLPDSVALPYASRSPRAGLRESIADVLPKGEARAAEVLARWGRGVSYHEFELALGDLTNLVVLDGFAPEMLEWLGLSVEEQLLIEYWKRKPIPVPIGFARKTIDVILRKPEGDAEA